MFFRHSGNLIGNCFFLSPPPPLPPQEPAYPSGILFFEDLNLRSHGDESGEAKERKRWRKNSSSITCSQANGGLLTYESLCYNYLRLPLYPFDIPSLFVALLQPSNRSVCGRGCMMSTAQFCIAYDIINELRCSVCYDSWVRYYLFHRRGKH